MRIKPLIPLFFFSLLSGCYTTSYTDEDKKSNFETLRLSPLPLSQQQMMTVVFKDALYTDEFGRINTEIEKRNDTKIDAISAGTELASDALLYTDIWSDAYISGNLLETSVMMLGGGYLLEKVFSDTTPDLYVSGFYKELSSGIPENLVQYSNQVADKTVTQFMAQMNELGYELDFINKCENPSTGITTRVSYRNYIPFSNGCQRLEKMASTDVSAPEILQYYFYHKDSAPIIDGTFYPRKVIVQTYFEPLLSASVDGKSLVQSEPKGWQVYLFNSSRNLIEDAYVNYRGFRKQPGTDFHRAFYANLSKEVDGHISVYRGQKLFVYHIAEGFYKGRLFRLNETLNSELSLIAGEIINLHEDNVFLKYTK